MNTSIRNTFIAILGFAAFMVALTALSVLFAEPASGMALALAAAPVLAKGSALSEADQKKVLQRFTGRYTGDHTPDWVRDAEAIGVVYPLQFKDDAEFLSRTKFAVTKEGALTARKTCEAMPTWPNGKKVRTATEAERVAAAKAAAIADEAEAEAEEAAAIAAAIEDAAGVTEE